MTMESEDPEKAPFDEQGHRADPNSRSILVWGFFSAVLVVASVIGLQALFYTYDAAVTNERASRDITSANLVAEQEARLQQTGWIDREQPSIAIPIDRAMELVVDELSQSKGRKTP